MMIQERKNLSRTLKRIHVACRRVNHDLGWICAVLSESDEPDCDEVAREAGLQVADELDRLVQSLRVACGVEQE